MAAFRPRRTNLTESLKLHNQKESSIICYHLRETDVSETDPRSKRAMASLLTFLRFRREKSNIPPPVRPVLLLQIPTPPAWSSQPDSLWQTSFSKCKLGIMPMVDI